MPRELKTFFYKAHAVGSLREISDGKAMVQTAVRATSRTAAVDALNRVGIHVTMHTFKIYASEAAPRATIDAHPPLTVVGWSIADPRGAETPVTVIEAVR